MIKITDYANLGADREILSFAADSLGVDGVELYVVESDKTLDKYDDKRWNVNAVLHRLPLPNTYELVLRHETDKPLPLVLCHEIVHLCQFTQGRLEFDDRAKKFLWEGRQFDVSYPYDSRPWEREAMRKEGELYRAYRKNKATCKCKLLFWKKG